MSLSSLRIENFAIIEHLEINFQSGLTILTGETGAGKSIIIDALNLALGEKASPTIIRAGAESATVECVFRQERKNQRFKKLLSAKGIRITDNMLTLKREVSLSGRSKGWVNANSCPIATLKEIGNLLVDLHGQHDHQSLLDSATHIQFLDAFGDYAELVSETARLFDEINVLMTRRELLVQQIRLNKEKHELWEFQLREIQKVNPQDGEYQELLAEKTILENAERIHLLVNDLIQQLSEAPESIYQKLLTVTKSLSNLQKYAPAFEEARNRLTDSQYYCQDLAKQLERFGAQVQYNPLRLETVNQRLYAFQQLMKKYGPEISQVLDFARELTTSLQSNDDLGLQLTGTENELATLRERYTAVALELSQRRGELARVFERELERILNRIGIGGARFVVALEKQTDAHGWVTLDGKTYRGTSEGLDLVTFMISTNPGEPLRPLAEIVSGGEVSRIMLAVKSLLAGRDQIPVLIFDEIDTGISGKIARVVGEELRGLAQAHQVICITHLPQIAGLADDHLSVRKVTEQGRSQTRVRRLAAEERVAEIAQLIGGKSISETTLEQARELLG